ncbi:MAG: deoxyribose-phosphate aldolase [Prevotellaceae bacterium]|jgi:deoxyribose-phosphate aldolase|nr:deoxyribose-phosphate aldolase [Prevotellaceae bacterium]
MDTLAIAFEDYSTEVATEAVAGQLRVIAEEAKRLHSVDVYRQCLSFVDYTSLNATDTPAHGRSLAEKVNSFSKRYPSLPNVAAICVYPSLVEPVRKTLKAEGVRIAAVAAGFPAAQTFLEVKLKECRLAIEAGASEVDVVISLGYLLGGEAPTAFGELARIKSEAGGGGCHLKVILETGLLPSLPLVRKASLGSLMAGADFIKTSTGKVEPAATPEAALVMCQAIKDYHAQTGKKAGFKAAGGIATTADAVMYYAIVKHVLGEAWLTPALFRIGASRLANKLLSDITGKEEKHF